MLKAWSLDHQHRDHLGFQKEKTLRPHPNLLNQKLEGWPPGSISTHFPDDVNDTDFEDC